MPPARPTAAAARRAPRRPADRLVMDTTLTPPAAPPSQHPHPHADLSRIAQDLQIRKVQVEAVVQLLDEGNTVPFITRYRKERTGGLNEDVIRRVQHRIAQLRSLAD